MATYLDPGATIELLKKVFFDLPKLDGARCVGRHALFDPRGVDEEPEAARQRHEQAVELCRRCPVIEQCATFTSSERDVGQVRAGRMPRPAQRVGRPRRTPSTTSEARTA
ncbi:MAG: WhiB family transcriptional regulator [Gordonia sp. (in: high G+C Gram-positive bacteria)]|uniref:WhiB family transcriptional regulator n=1 Tax=Gordonia sp. (in: high G+C Gram-positive bacteria) TaxID=84139 RepID=UPI003C739C60